MAIERRLMQKLESWKSNPVRRALLLDGARQVGKTYAVRAFAKSHYDIFLEVNFVETPGARAIFDGDLGKQ